MEMTISLPAGWAVVGLSAEVDGMARLSRTAHLWLQEQTAVGCIRRTRSACQRKQDGGNWHRQAEAELPALIGVDLKFVRHR
jgi:hypothetical protein